MTPPRIVVDSNVIISGFLFGGNPAMVLGTIVEGVTCCFTSLLNLKQWENIRITSPAEFIKEIGGQHRITRYGAKPRRP